MIIQSRRNFITGLTGLLAAPAIVRAGSSLMPVRSYKSAIDIINEAAEFVSEEHNYLWYQEQARITLKHWQHLHLIEARCGRLRNK